MRAFYISVLLALVFGFLHAKHVEAATIELYSDPVMGCTMLLSGSIVEGDAERLEELVSELREAEPNNIVGRLCLNSPGGSYREGVRLAQSIQGIFYLGTAIAQGHRCESACAIAFMAGGYAEEGLPPVRPIMHPHSTLGFHAPSIEIPSGQYSEQQVTQAWNVALQAISEIVTMRSGSSDVIAGYNFVDALFRQMLLTPSESMYYIDTVEKAARYDIAVYPVGLNSAQPADAFRNLCRFVDGPQYGSFNVVPIMRSSSPDGAEAFFRYGFGGEATYSCRAVLSLDRLRDREVFLFQTRPVLIEFGGDERGAGEVNSSRGAYPYMSFDLSTKLDQLPTDIEGSWREFVSRIEVSARPAAEPFGSCWLRAPTARVTNVTTYVNLRRWPELSATVIREVPLGELMSTPANNITVIGEERDRQACISACEAFGRDGGNQTARDRVQQCIVENMLWNEVTDALNNRGWVSRRYLEEVN